MTDTFVSIHLKQSGRDSTTLTLGVANDVNVSIKLNDQQLLYLAVEAVNIVHERTLRGSIKADELRKALADLVVAEERIKV